MKRRSFVKNASIGTAALSIIPFLGSSMFVDPLVH
ncbi:MAG: twin-arginine translocation signal domain-containing protein [Cyclobacteriaceae bacterium]